MEIEKYGQTKTKGLWVIIRKGSGLLRLAARSCIDQIKKFILSHERFVRKTHITVLTKTENVNMWLKVF